MMFAIFGNPVAHSKSPLMHNYFFKKEKLNHCYGRYLLENGEDIIKKFKELKLNGANVTVPHKEWAYKLADEVRGVAKDMKAVNTLVLENGKVIGYNTDGPGFMEVIKEFDYKKPLIIGAGGTARAISYLLKADIVNRSENRLKFFKEKGFNTYTWDTFEFKEYDLIINTTSAGLKDDSLPMPKEMLERVFKNAKYAVDVVYGKETPFLRLAKKYNLITKDGLYLLVYQGILAMELFLGKELDKKKVANIYFDILA